MCVLRLCIYGPEVRQSEHIAAISSGTVVPYLIAENFIQYVSDNIDNNICTLNGQNTLHGMGMIATVTHGTHRTKATSQVTVSAEDIALYLPQLQ